MACQTIYSEWMSLELDGLLDAEAGHRLRTHVADCVECASLWHAMKEADSHFVVSAREPVTVPQDFTLKVMQRVAAAPVWRPQLEIEPVPSPQFAPASGSIIPTRALPAGDAEVPFHLP